MKVRCKNCKTEIEIKDGMTWNSCTCFNIEKNMGVFVDGWGSKARYGGNKKHLEVIDEGRTCFL